MSKRKQLRVIAAVLCLCVVNPGASLLNAATPAVSKSADQTLARAPEVSRTSLYGLEAGQTTQLVVFGTDLLPNPKVVGLPAGTQTLRAGATAERLEFDVTIPAGTPIGHFPLRVRTTHGISRAIPVAVDGLPQAALGQGDLHHPLNLPVAVSGEVPLGKPAQAFVAGKAGQRVVVDVECRRLGGSISPVIELKNARRTPIAIQWSQAELQGDARIIAELPADGVYIVELHDLAFKVSGNNPFRLKIGDLKLADAVFPAVLPAGTRREVKLIGPGWDGSAPLTADASGLVAGSTRSVAIPSAHGVAAPAPIITAGEGIEVFERGAGESPQKVNCLFSEEPKLAVSINGRISQSGEVDKYLLQVRPDQKLHLRIDSRRMHSRLDSQLTLAQADGTILAQSEDRPDLLVTVPAGVNSLLATVRDLHGLGGADFPYRLVVSPADQPGFTMSLREDRILLPRDGLATVRLDLDRQGYSGPIALTAEGATQLQITPSEIPANVSAALVQLSVRPGARHQSMHSVRIIGESRGLATPIRRVAAAQSGTMYSLVTEGRYDLPVAVLPSSGFAMSLPVVPRIWYHGLPAGIPVSIDAEKLPPGIQALTLTLVSTEVPQNRTQNPIRGTFSVVRNTDVPSKPIPLWTKVEPDKKKDDKDKKDDKKDKEKKVVSRLLKDAVVDLRVPYEGVDRDFDCTVRADLLTDVNDLRPVASVYTKAFHVSVPQAARIKHTVNTIILASGGPTKFVGHVTRHPEFKETIEAALTGFASEYSAPKVTIPPDQDQFEIIITSPKVTAGGEILNINFVLKDLQGHRLQPDELFSTRIVLKK